MPGTIFRLLDIEVDEKNATISRNGDSINLTGRAFDLFVALLKANSNLVSHDEIMEQVWNNRIVNDETIKQNISRIRSALGDSSKDPKYITSVRGKGYKCVAPVHIIESPVDSKPEIYQPETNTFRMSSWVSYVSVFGLAVILVGIVLFMVFRQSPVQSGNKLRLVVLPFKTLNRDDSDDYLADGLTEEFISSLAQNDDLKVLARGAVSAASGVDYPIAEIGKRLDVAALVDGKIRRVGDRIRVYVKLIDASDLEHFWSVEFNRPYQDLFSIRQEVVDKISNTLLSSTDSQKLEIPTKVIAAYDDLLKGQAEYRQYNQDSNDKAIMFFQRAVKRDPGFAKAHAWLANSYAIKSIHRLGDIYADKAIATAKKALQLDNTSFIANKAFGIAYSNQGKYQLARESSERTLKMSPDYYPAGVNNLASVYMDTGQFALAAEQYLLILKNYSKDTPIPAVAYAHYARNMMLLGYLDIAEQALAIADEIDPTHPNVMIVQNDFLYLKGNHSLAREKSDEYVQITKDCSYCLLIAADNHYFAENFDKALEYYEMLFKGKSVAETSAAIQIAMIKLLQGKKDEATKILEDVEHKEHKYINAGHEGWIHYSKLGHIAAIRKNHEQAYEWYVKAVNSGYHSSLYLEVEPSLAEFRQTQYFVKIVKLMEAELNRQRRYVTDNKIDAFFARS